MNFHSNSNLDAAYIGIAKAFIQQVQDKADTVAVMPVGVDGEALFQAIQNELKTTTLDFSQVRLFQPFEFVPLSTSHDNLVGSKFIKLWSQLPGSDIHNFYCFHSDEWDQFLKELSYDDPRMLFPRGMDTSLRNRLRPSEEDALQEDCIQLLDAIAERTEEKLREFGGIDFCAQALGYGGRLFMNISGSSHYSACRLTLLNYEAMAEHATWVGGIDEARKTAALTLGLGALLINPQTQIHLIGLNEEISREVKALKDGELSVTLPASVAIRLQNSHVWYTPDSGMDLAEGANGSFMSLDNQARIQFVQDCIQAGQKLFEKRAVIHTAPHHDDIELGYFPLFIQDPQTDRHTISYLTSGYRSVADDFFQSRFEMMKVEFELGLESESIEVILKNNLEAKWLGRHQDALKWESLYLLNRLKEEFHSQGLGDLEAELAAYFNGTLADSTQEAYNNFLKSCIREWEGELVWAHLGFEPSQVHHLKLALYHGTHQEVVDNIEEIAKPFFKQMESIHPDVVTVIQDPEASAPKTHFRCLLAVREAVRQYQEKYPDNDLTVLTYRNVWTRFPISESNIIVPASLNDLAAQERMFENCFVSQFIAQYPSPGHDGSFAELASKVWMEQFGQIKSIIPSEFLTQHEDPRFRKMSAAIFMKEYSASEFLKNF